MIPSPELSPGYDHQPQVIIDAAYYDRLERIAYGAQQRFPSVAARLLQEIDRGLILPSEKMPADVVNIGSEITYRDDMSGRDHTVTLVLPVGANISEGRVSVLTPVGAALIGLSEGASIDWETNAGERRQLTIIRVARVASCRHVAAPD